MADILVVVYPERKHYPQRRRLQHEDISQSFVNAPETNPSFIARYSQTYYFNIRYEHEAFTDGPAIPNLPVADSFLGKYRAASYRRFRFNVDDLSFSTVPIPEAPQSFVAKYRPPSLRRFLYNTSEDTSETSTPIMLPTANYDLTIFRPRRAGPYR